MHIVQCDYFLFSNDEYIGEVEVRLDWRIRTHLQDTLGNNRVQPVGIDALNDTWHSVIWIPMHMWPAQVCKAIRVTKGNEMI